MKKIGIVGGVGWPSTVDYYSALCRLTEEHFHSKERGELAQMPEFSIESLDLKRVLSAIGTEGNESSWASFDDYHRNALKRLEASGAEFALMASNSPHHRFASIIRGITIPVLNMFDIVAERAAATPSRPVLICGTALVMRSEVLRSAFLKREIHCGPPSPEIQSELIELLGAIHAGDSRGAKERFEKLVALAIETTEGIPPVVCLACTELPLLFPEQKEAEIFEDKGVTYLNTMAVHIRAAFNEALAGCPAAE